MNKASKKVYIIILNWNGWEDTIECLESVFRNAYPNYKVIVCDNNSSDNSLDKIKQWANGKLRAKQSKENFISTFTIPPVSKPIQYIEYDRKQAELGGYTEENASLILIQTGDNLGFAGGNNVGIRYALARDKFKYIWMLNNDTIIEKNALVHLVRRMEVNSLIGICGSTLLFYDRPNVIQALGGGVLNKWFSTSKHIGVNQKSNISIDTEAIERKMDYVTGASMLATRQFILDIGLMSEEYFLYFEELDWIFRAKSKYTLGYADNSIVYHKEGGTIGSNSTGHLKSELSDYYLIQNRLMFSRKYLKKYLIFTYLGLMISIINRIIRGQYSRIIMIFKIICKDLGILPRGAKR